MPNRSTNLAATIGVGLLLAGCGFERVGRTRTGTHHHRREREGSPDERGRGGHTAADGRFVHQRHLRRIGSPRRPSEGPQRERCR